MSTQLAQDQSENHSDEPFSYAELPAQGGGLVLGFRCATRDLVSAFEHVHSLCRASEGLYGLAVDGTHGYLFGADGEFWAVGRFAVTAAVRGRATMREASAQALLEVAVDDREVALEVRRDGSGQSILRYATAAGARASQTVREGIHFPFAPEMPFQLEQGTPLATLRKALRTRQPTLNTMPIAGRVARCLSKMSSALPVRSHCGDGFKAFYSPSAALGWGVVSAEPAADLPLKEAERWRSTLIGVVQSVADPRVLHDALMDGIHSRAWAHLTDEVGNKFRDFEEFCAAAPPFGPGVSAERVREILEKLVGRREADVLLVPPARQGIKDGTSRQPGGKSARVNERLRAVERAPEPIRKLYALGGVSLADAARLSAASKGELEPAATRAAEMLTALGDKPAAAALHQARKSFKPEKPDESAARRILRQVEQLSPNDRDEFNRLYTAWHTSRQGPGLAKASDSEVEKAQAALVSMGWKVKQAKGALESLRGSSATTAEQLIRDASALLTK